MKLKIKQKEKKDIFMIITSFLMVLFFGGGMVITKELDVFISIFGGNKYSL